MYSSSKLILNLCVADYDLQPHCLPAFKTVKAVLHAEREFQRDRLATDRHTSHCTNV